MVLKILTNGLGGDLNNALDNFGLDNDLITILDQTTPFSYTIYTLSGADLIELRDADTENSVFSGAGRDTVRGGNAKEFIFDQSGNDLFLLRGGEDSYYCGKGSDTADGGAGTDLISFYYIYNDAGDDAPNTTGITCDLAKTGVQDFGVFGKDRIKGFEDVDGGEGADRLFGTGGANEIVGNGGKDLLIGRGGADFFGLFDASGASRDIVRYTRITDSGTGLSLSAIDVILNFDQGGTPTDDKIDLRSIDARPGLAGNQAFLFRGTGAFTSPKGEVRLVEGSGSTLVQVDIDGDGASEMNILVLGVTSLTATDFIL